MTRRLLISAVIVTSVQVLAQESPRDVKITATEFSFNPKKVQVQPGEVRFVVTNRGEFPHGLAIVGKKEKIGYIDTGETKSLSVKFDKSEELIFYCPQPGHRKKGMEGKLIIGP